MFYCRDCSKYKYKEDRDFSASRIQRKIRQCKQCKRTYDQERATKYRKIDRNVVKLRKHLECLLSKEAADKVVSAEQLELMFKKREIEIDKYNKVLVFPPANKLDSWDLLKYQVVVY